MTTNQLHGLADNLWAQIGAVTVAAAVLIWLAARYVW
jgi:hypothetical protein